MSGFYNNNVVYEVFVKDWLYKFDSRQHENSFKAQT